MRMRTDHKITDTQQQTNNLRLAAVINKYWEGRGVKANASVERKRVAITREFVTTAYRDKNGATLKRTKEIRFNPPRYVLSWEIDSHLGTLVRWLP